MYTHSLATSCYSPFVETGSLDGIQGMARQVLCVGSGRYRLSLVFSAFARSDSEARWVSSMQRDTSLLRSCSHAIVSDSAELVDILKPRMLSMRKKSFPDASPFEEGQKVATLPDTPNKRYSKMRLFTE